MNYTNSHRVHRTVLNSGWFEVPRLLDCMDCSVFSPEYNWSHFYTSSIDRFASSSHDSIDFVWNMSRSIDLNWFDEHNEQNHSNRCSNLHKLVVLLGERHLQLPEIQIFFKEKNVFKTNLCLPPNWLHKLHNSFHSNKPMSTDSAPSIVSGPVVNRQHERNNRNRHPEP